MSVRLDVYRQHVKKECRKMPPRCLRTGHFLPEIQEIIDKVNAMGGYVKFNVGDALNGYERILT